MWMFRGWVILQSLAIASLIATIETGTANACANYESHLHVVSVLRGTLGSPTRPAVDVVARGGFAYVAAQVRGLQTVDVSNPRAPSLVSSIPLEGFARQVILRGDLLLVATTAGLSIADVSEGVPLILSETPIGSVRSVAASATRAYVSVYGGTVQGFGIENPADPVLLHEFPAGDRSPDLALGGERLYVESGDAIEVFDISGPGTPVLIEVLAVAIDGRPAVDDGILYVPVGHLGLHLYDTATLGLIGAIDLTTSIEGVVVAGHYAWCRARYGVRVIDATHPSAPVLVGSHGIGNSPGGPAVSGGYLYVVNNYDLVILDASDPTSAPLISGLVGVLAYTTGIESDGRYAYLTGVNSLQVLDMGDPRVPTCVGLVEMPSPSSHAWQSSISGAHAYVACSGSNPDSSEGVVAVVDISNPEAPKVAGAFEMPAAYDVEVVGGYAYVATATSGLWILDVSDPTVPVFVAQLGLSYHAWDVEVVGGLAFVAAGKVYIVDVADPNTPIIVGWTWWWGARDVDVEGDYAYLAADAVHVYDITDPTSPQLVTSIWTPYEACGVSVQGNTAYIADSYGGVEVASVEPGAMRIIGGIGTVRSVFRVLPRPDYVLAADDEGYIYVLPTQCEPTPILLSGFCASVGFRRVDLTWHTSFEHLHDGFNVYRSRQLTTGYARLNEGLVQGHSPYSYSDQTVGPDRVYYYKLGAVDLRGHEVLYDPISVTTPVWRDRTELRLASPSPFRRETALNFTLATPSEVRLAIYDVAGRLVRVLVNEDLPVGDHSAVWNGRDGSGVPVAPGVYFVRLKSGTFDEAQQVVRIR